MRITETIPPRTDGTLSMIAVASGEGPRYACLNGLDGFGRVLDGRYSPGARPFGACSAVYYEP